MNKTQAAAYFAAMIDGEGCVRVGKNRSVSVSNTERDIIDAVAECCELLGLPYRITDIKRANAKWKDGWELYVTGKTSLETIQREVPIRSQRKAASLATAIAAFKHKPRPAREWLEQKYTLEGLSLQQVAEAWGVKNSVSAHGWLKFYGIPRRSQSEAQTKYPRPSREWLQARVDEGLTLKAIGEHPDLPVTTPFPAVWHWCKHYEIERTHDG